MYLFAAMMMAATPYDMMAQQKPGKHNLEVKEWNTDVKTGVRVLDHVTIYNANGRKIEETEYTTSKMKWRKRYEYDNSGKMIRELVYDDRNRLTYIKKLEYNATGHKRTQTTSNAKGKVISIKNYEYLNRK